MLTSEDKFQVMQDMFEEWVQDFLIQHPDLPFKLNGFEFERDVVMGKGTSFHAVTLTYKGYPDKYDWESMEKETV